jgi:hypothetical protein
MNIRELNTRQKREHTIFERGGYLFHELGEARGWSPTKRTVDDNEVEHPRWQTPSRCRECRGRGTTQPRPRRVGASKVELQDDGNTPTGQPMEREPPALFPKWEGSDRGAGGRGRGMVRWG